jgi:betaine-aldehyde dehydrogenase
MFCAGKSAAPLAAGNSVIVKPPEQAPLSSLRLAELIGDLLSPGVFNILPGSRDAGSALVAHPGVAMVALIGSVPTGRAVMRSAAAGIKPTLLELGGKNALIAFGDVEPQRVAAAIVAGMNFTWCGQSCGSTSRAFVHDSIHERVIEQVVQEVAAFKPGSPTEPSTTMGAAASAAQFDRVLAYIEAGKREGARIVHGGGRPSAPELSRGWFIEPTIFADVTADMTIAREEVFGPVLSILTWSDEGAMVRAVNNTEFRLDLLDLDKRSQSRASYGHAGRSRICVDQSCRKASAWRAFRWIQAIRNGARGMPRGASVRYAGEEHLLAAELNNTFKRCGI